MSTKRNVLIIEDNADIGNLLCLHLRDLDCKVTWQQDGVSGLKMATAEKYCLIILDLMLPGMDGLEVCRNLRAAEDYTPILMLSAKSSDVERVVGLEIGADDYLTKPFSIHELLARVKAIFRRNEIFSAAKSENQAIRVLGNLTLDPEKREVFVSGKQIDLTAKEFDLLTHFSSNVGRVFTRQQLLDQVWGHSYCGYEHTVNSHINRLRSKIETDTSDPDHILTVWGVGYKFNYT